MIFDIIRKSLSIGVIRRALLETVFECAIFDKIFKINVPIGGTFEVTMD